MRILVTGATGSVGRRLLPRLLSWNDAPGAEVRVLVRDEARGAAFAARGARVVPGDLTREDGLPAAVAGMDAVLNLAAAFRDVPDDAAWAVNHRAAVALGRAARAAGVTRFVQVSTNLVYGAGRGRPHLESDRPVPVAGPLWGAYPQSKWAAEQDLRELDGLDVRIGRLAFVYGEGDGHLAAAPRWITAWPAHKRLQLVHQADAARGLWRLLRAPAAPGPAYNFADDAPVSAVELLTLLALPVPEGMAGRTDPDPWHGIAANDLARDHLGWRPRHPSLRSAMDAGAL
ncbi:NAD-dependent epimerase/dehydratase family protein [Streptomyces aidingensis]|uniref:Nucleoside-diphosphate-sugar epimerase n=1 Tax=Streptomyces aidingensis TaxID=910347 RepID=A0A1I1NLI5_9ACTN|nr:NAD-dependent epimerase/dehydratase family protein [Streptomyces aidingensis]SFC98122.1 Nucleoside-diphosphate-sugar epimerase [Streptomyces aidingensis]